MSSKIFRARSYSFRSFEDSSGLKRFIAQNKSEPRTELHDFCVNSANFFANSVSILKNFESIPERMVQSSTRHEKLIHKANSRLDFLSKSLGALSYQSQNALAAVGRLRKQVAQSVSTVMLITADIKPIILMLSEFSKQTLAKIRANR